MIDHQIHVQLLLHASHWSGCWKECFAKSAGNNKLKCFNCLGDDFPNAESLLEALFQLDEAASGSLNSLVPGSLDACNINLSTDAGLGASATSSGHEQSSTNSGMKF